MNTLRQIAALVLKEVAGGTPTQDLNVTERQVIIKLRLVLNEILSVQIEQRMLRGKKGIVTQAIYTYKGPNNEGIEVDKTEKSPYAYIDIPNYYISLPYNKGIYQVCPFKDPFKPYVPRHNQEVTRNLKCGDLQGRAGYWVEGNKIVLHHKDKVENRAVLKTLCLAPDAIGINDAFPVPPEYIPDAVRIVKDELLAMPIHDEINDGNADKGVKYNEPRG